MPRTRWNLPKLALPIDLRADETLLLPSFDRVNCVHWNYEDVGPVTRLVTFVDVDDDAADSRRMSVAARHEAVLVDGRHVLLLDDRGWSESGPPDIWAATSVEDIVGTARVVVGPDEPFGGRSHGDMAADHGAHVSQILRQHGVVVDALELQRLPHDVVLSERLLARLSHDPGDAVKP